MIKKSRVLLGVGVLNLFLATTAGALNVQLLRPSTGHVQGYQLFTSETLPKYYLAVGVNFNLAENPFEETIAGTTTRIAGVVDQFVTADFLVSYGVTDWMTLNVDMPVNIFHNIAPTLIPTRDKGGGDPGDLEVNAKFRIFDANKTASHLGLALVPFVTVQTGRESIFFGDASATGGAVVVGDAQWKSNRFYLNVGARFRKREQFGDLIVHHELLYGVGFERPLVKKWAFNVIAEVYGSTNFRKFARQNITSPVEGLLIFQKKWLPNRNLVTNLGGGAGITSGYGMPDFRVIFGIAYAWDLKPKEQPPPVVREEVITTNKIHFQYDKDRIMPASYPVLDQIVATIKGRPEIQHVTIEGHTDGRGSEEYNNRLSQRRAEAVQAYLVSHGIAESRLSAVGKGKGSPIAPNQINGKDNPQGRALNRRVEFHLQVREGTRLKVMESTEQSPTYQQ